jgi:PAS domain S-box-containing protein
VKTLSDVKILLAPERLPLRRCEQNMPNSETLLWRKPPLIWRYGTAVLAVTAALIVSRQPPLHLQTAPVSLFLCAIMVSAWLGGFGPGLFATILSILAFDYYFLEPLHSFAIKPEEIPRATVFLLSALFVGTLSAAQRSATESLRRARDNLKKTVQELEKTNEVLQAESGVRKRAEAELQRSQAYLAEAQRLSNTGSFGWKVSSGEILWSDETFRIFQYDRATKPTAELVLQRVHPGDAAVVKQSIDSALQDGRDFDFEHRLVIPDGSVKHVHVIGHAHRDESGSIEFVGAVQDITGRKLGEEALRRSENYLAEAQRLTHTGSWVWQVAGGDALHLSDEWYRIYGFDPAEGMPAWEKRLQRVHPEDRANWQGTIDRAIREKSDYEMEFRILLPDGTVKYNRSIGHPVLNASGDLVQFVGISMDISASKRAEEAQADFARVSRVTTMGELTASLAHEVNQPIAAAVTDANTCLRWLMRDHPDLEEARAAASRIVKDATRAAEIVSRVRLLFRKGTPQRELVDVNELIRGLIVLLRSEATRYSIAMRTDLATNLPQLMGDSVQLQQVMMNLIINSIDAMKDVAGTRELAIKSELGEDKHLLVSIRDTGVGLPPRQTEQIFNAFFTTKPHGTGMGLRISRSIVESHGGRLWASHNFPRGASFFFTLPTKTEAQE